MTETQLERLFKRKKRWRKFCRWFWGDFMDAIPIVGLAIVLIVWIIWGIFFQ